MRVGSISYFSSFWCVLTPKGVFAKPRDHHHQQPFLAFLALMLWLLSSFRLGFTDHLVAGAGRQSYGVDSSFLFPDPSLSQTLRQRCPDWQKKLGWRHGHELLICLLEESLPIERYGRQPSAILTKRATNEMRYSRSSEGSLVRWESQLEKSENPCFQGYKVNYTLKTPVFTYFLLNFIFLAENINRMLIIYLTSKLL